MRRGACVAVVGLALAVCSGPPAQAQPRPHIAFDTESVDLGRVEGTAPVGATFRLRNTGEAPLEIIDLQAACGCIAALVSTPVLQPGQSGEIVVRLDPTRVGTRKTRIVTVYSNDPVRPVVHLKLTADIASPIELSESVVNFGTLAMGEVRERTLIVFTTADYPLTLAGVEAASSLLSFTWTHTESGDRPAYVITIRLGTGALPGAFADTLRVTFVEPESPQVEVPVRAHVAGPIVATPSVLGLGAVRKGATPERTVLVTAPALPTFRIERVESTSEHVLPIVRVADEENGYLLSVRVGPDAPRGRLHAILRVYTNVQAHPLLEVPVAGIVR